MSILGNALNAVKSLEAEMDQRGDFIDCELDLKDGDWGGKLMLVSVSPRAAALIARQLLQLVERNVERNVDGAHFDIDRASIAPGSADQLCVALKGPAKVSHA